MFENLSIGHLLIVLAVFLLIFGAKRLPEMGQSLGQGIKEFKKSFSEIRGSEEPRESLREAPRESSRTTLSEPRGLDRSTEERPEPKRLIR